MAYYEEMRRRFRELAEAAALATDTSAEIAFSGVATTLRTNRTLADRWVANAAAFGVADVGPDESPGSTDMGNVSWVCPAIHPELAIVPLGTPGHSIAFRDAAATELADETTLLAATLVAQTAYELFVDDALRAAVRAEFEG
jgi:metal-dependent amidase/aminoacylase/carboxypeptidase family protein